MILDKISNQSLYSSIHSNFQQVFDFIKNNDLMNMELGKHIIDGEKVFVMLMEYTTQERLKCKCETHKKYIDIQYMIQGEEYIGLKTRHKEQASTPYNKEGDFMFYKLSKLPVLPLKEKHFAIFFPDDIHQTMIQIEEPKKLRKAVFKVLQ